MHLPLRTLLGLALLSTACTEEPDEPGAIGVVEFEIGAGSVKELTFTWSVASGAEDYQLLEQLEPGAEFVEVGAPTTETETNRSLALHRSLDATYVLRACNTISCRESDPVSAAPAISQAIGYIKPAGTSSRDRFGASVALSADGSTLAVGASGAESDAEPGSVHVFGRDAAGAWVELAEIAASNAGEGDRFGASVALNANGSVLAVGAPEEDGGENGTTAKQDSGAAYVFVRDAEAETWAEQAYIKAPNYDLTNLKVSDLFGVSVTLDDAGEALAIGASREGSGAGAGAVYVYDRADASEAGWTLDRTLKAPTPDDGDDFGLSIAFDGTGETLAIGAPGEDSGSSGIDGDASDNSSGDTGAVYVFSRVRGPDDPSVWQWAEAPVYIKPTNPEAEAEFGRVGLSAAGDVLAVGAPRSEGLGSAYVFTRESETGAWVQAIEIVDPSPDGARDEFGDALALSADGRVLAIGVPEDDSVATGLGGDEANVDGFRSGAVRVYAGDGRWLSTPVPVYVKASNTDDDDEFGRAIALDASGETLAVGAISEDGNGDDPTNNAASNAGAVYLY